MQVLEYQRLMAKPAGPDLRNSLVVRALVVVVPLFAFFSMGEPFGFVLGFG